jgi:hypothetical protein
MTIPIVSTNFNRVNSIDQDDHEMMTHHHIHNKHRCTSSNRLNGSSSNTEDEPEHDDINTMNYQQQQVGIINRYDPEDEDSTNNDDYVHRRISTKTSCQQFYTDHCIYLPAVRTDCIVTSIFKTNKHDYDNFSRFDKFYVDSTRYFSKNVT